MKGITVQSSPKCGSFSIVTLVSQLYVGCFFPPYQWKCHLPLKVILADLVKQMNIFLSTDAFPNNLFLWECRSWPAWPSPLRNIDRNMILMLTALKNSQGVFGALGNVSFCSSQTGLQPEGWAQKGQKNWKHGLPGKTGLFLLSWSQRRV